MRKLAMEELERVSVEDFKRQDKLKVTVILDNVRSLHNVGSIFRTADGFAVEAIVLCGITGTPPHRDIEKTALGATQSVDWRYAENATGEIQSLQSKGYTVLAVEQAKGSVYLHHFEADPHRDYALVFGNEVDGVSDAAMAQVDGCVEIPQFGTKHSFNIVVSAGIVLWDLYHKLKLK